MKHKTTILCTCIFISLCATARCQTPTDGNKSLAQLCDGDSSCEKAALKQVAKSRAEKAGSSNPSNIVKKNKATPPFALPTLSSQVTTPGQQCQDATQALFLRKDSTDNFNYVDSVFPSESGQPSSADAGGGQPASANAAGASFNYTDDVQAANQKATFNFRLSYLLIGKHDCTAPVIGAGPETEPRKPYMFGLAFAPFVSSDGTWNEPFTTTTTTTKAASTKTPAGPSIITVKRTSDATTVTTVTTSSGTTTTTTKKTSTSALRVGADFQYALNTLTWPIQQSFFYASPFYQTDVRGAAEIGGADLWWSPVSGPIALGVGKTYPYYFNFFWQFKGEVELTQVSNPGYTDFTPGQHAQLGEQIRPHINLFPRSSGFDYLPWVDSWIAGRLSFIGTQQYYFDTASKRSAAYYTAQLQYKLGQCEKKNTSDDGNTDNTNSDSSKFNSECSGTSTLSLEYDWGKDKDTYVKTNQFLAKLTFAY